MHVVWRLKFFMGIKGGINIYIYIYIYCYCPLPSHSSTWLTQRWGSLGNTHRQAQELDSGPCLGTKARLFSFNRMQSRVVKGLLTGHNTLRRHLHLMGLIDSPLYRKCAAEDETSVHILCQCEALASLRHAYLGCFFLEPESINPLPALT
jgi:hypothetical protein